MKSTTLTEIYVIHVDGDMLTGTLLYMFDGDNYFWNGELSQLKKFLSEHAYGQRFYIVPANL